MNDETVRNLLKQLHGMLDGATSVTDEDRELLQQLSADIQALLAKPGAATRATRRTTVGQLRAAVTRFEVSHPDLTAVMAQVTKALGDMGI
jgi:tRNA C32,U32 (ribose-2'-O)-methylase TrmJ